MALRHPPRCPQGVLHRLDRGRQGDHGGCAEQVKRVTLELGGKSANVVFADADIELAAARAPYGVFDNAGQDCCARSRILVERSAYDQFMALLEPAVRGVVVGDPLDERTEMGPSSRRRTSKRSPRSSPTTPRWPSAARLPQARQLVRANGAGAGRTLRTSGHRGDLRTGGGRRPLRGRSRGRCHRQRQHLRAVRLDLVPKRRSGAPRGACHRLGNLSVNSHSSVRYWSPSGASSSPGSAGNSGPTRSVHSVM